MALGLVLGGLAAASGIAQASAAKKASDAQVEASQNAAQLQLQGQREAIAAQKAAEDRVYAETAYSRKLGENALTKMSQMGAFDPGDYTASDEYGLQLTEGTNALNNMAAASGMSRSGAAMKDALRYSQGLAAADYSDWYAREETTYNNDYNRLLGVANIGSGSQAQQIAATQSTANNVSNALISGNNSIANSMLAAGDARASGYTNTGNALSGMFGDGAGLLGLHQGGYFS